jgi:serine protease AprX
VDDGIAPWSSYGTTQDLHSKPEIVAPGRNIVSVLSSSSGTMATQFPERRVDNSYFRLSGTSMAAPVVAGIAALAFQAHPEWTNDQLKWLLMNTATPLAIVPAEAQGKGQADARAVVTYGGTPGYANQGLTLNLNLVTADGTTSYTSANWSSANWSSANWSSANWSSANWSSANWSSANWSSASFASASEASVE